MNKNSIKNGKHSMISGVSNWINRIIVTWPFLKFFFPVILCHLTNERSLRFTRREGLITKIDSILSMSVTSHGPPALKTRGRNWKTYFNHWFTFYQFTEQSLLKTCICYINLIIHLLSAALFIVLGLKPSEWLLNLLNHLTTRGN